MKYWNLLCVLLYSSGAMCAPSIPSTTQEPTSTTVKQVVADNGSIETSAEAAAPLNMNIADYYYSIFGKHLDYDYREPVITFEEPNDNHLSDEVLSEVDKSNVEPWDTHSRKKRFILAPMAFYNATRSWYQQRRKLRAERRRLRQERTRQWQTNRIQALRLRSESLQRQAERLMQLQLTQQRQQAQRLQAVASTNKVVVQRNVPEQETHKIVLHATSTTSTTAKSTSANVKSDPIPAKQVPI